MLLATLNRESGILISLTWFIFNSNIKKFIYINIITLSTFVFINLDISSCLINPNFFIPVDKQVDYAKFNFRDIGVSISLFSAIKVILVNFIIPFGFCFYIYFTTESKNKITLYVLLIYLFIFIFALPLDHLSSRLILLPFIYVLIYFKDKTLAKVKF